MLFTDDSKSYSPVSYQISELKSLTRHRYRMIGYRSKLKLSVTRLIDIIFPELPDCVWSIHQNSSYSLLLELPTPKDICDCHLTKLTNLINKASHGKYDKDKAVFFFKSWPVTQLELPIVLPLLNYSRPYGLYNQFKLKLMF